MSGHSGLILVTGGTRSGKSAFAEELAAQLGGGAVAYLATARALDKEMQDRITRHRQRRPAGWDTYEEPQHLRTVLGSLAGHYRAVLIDCITLWVSNRLCEGEEDILAAASELADAAAAVQCPVIMVSGEVGLGLIGDSYLGRQFADLLGSTNQILARAADDVYFVAAGLPFQLKKEGRLR